MKRVLMLWLTLLATFWAARTALSVALFARVDRGYEATLQLAVVPALQAAALAWMTRRPGGMPLALPWRLAWARQRLVLVLSAELIVLVLGWLATLGWLAPSGGGAPAARRWLALGEGASLATWSAAALLAAAAALCAWVAARRRQLPPAARVSLALLAASLAAAACQPLTGWLGALEGVVRMQGVVGSPPAAAGTPAGLAGSFAAPAAAPALLDAALAAAAGWLLLAATASLRSSSPAAARALEWTLGFAWLGLGAWLLGPGLRPAAPQPLAALAATFGGLAASAALVAAYCAAFVHEPAGRAAGPSSGRRRRVPIDRQTGG